MQAAKNLKRLTAGDHDIDEESVKDLVSKHVIVDLAPMHYGMGDRNPLEKVKFYSKRNPNCEFPHCFESGRRELIRSRFL